jgi:hypothetical protein
MAPAARAAIGVQDHMHLLSIETPVDISAPSRCGSRPRCPAPANRLVPATPVADVEEFGCAHQRAHHSRIIARFAETFGDSGRQRPQPQKQKHSITMDMNVQFQEFLRYS